MEDFTIGARLRAARHLKGYKRMEELAKAIDRPRGLGTTNLREIERDARPVPFGDLADIAHACGVPVEWFTADFSRLAEISEDPRKVLARELAAATQRAAAARQRTDDARTVGVARRRLPAARAAADARLRAARLRCRWHVEDDR